MKFYKMSGNGTTKPESQSQIFDSGKSQNPDYKVAPKKQQESSAMNKSLLGNHPMHIRLYP